MNVEAYLHRIDYRGSLTPTYETLRSLHRTHLLAVPFENLDIHLGRPIILDEARLFHKIVEERRGGFCYELNGMFAALLRELGFAVTMLSARVNDGNGELGPDFDHLVLQVDVEGRWLADVGFGSSFVEPLRLVENSEHKEGRRAYRLVSDGVHWTMLQRADAVEWREQYRFTLQPRRFSDFTEMCHYQQTSPQSHFTQGRVCTLATEDGRVTLTHDRLIVTTGDDRRETPIEGEDDFAAKLEKHFGIVLEAKFPGNPLG